MNLTYEVRNGIVKHSKGKGMIIPLNKAHKAATLEGQVVRVSDIFAYVNHDLDDALRAAVIKKTDIPKQVIRSLGDTHSKRIDTMVKDFITCSQKTDLEEICMSKKISSATYMLRDFLFERVYESDKLLREFRKAKKILHDLYNYYLAHMEEVFIDIPKEEKMNKHRMVCDFIAGMTDSFALMTYERLFLPQQWTVL